MISKCCHRPLRQIPQITSWEPLVYYLLSRIPFELSSKRASLYITLDESVQQKWTLLFPYTHFENESKQRPRLLSFYFLLLTSPCHCVGSSGVHSCHHGAFVFIGSRLHFLRLKKNLFYFFKVVLISALYNLYFLFCLPARVVYFS